MHVSYEPRLVDLLPRVAFFATALFLFGVGLRIYPATSVSDLVLTMELVIYTGAFGFLIAAFMRPLPASKVAQSAMAVSLALGIIASVSYEIQFANPTYGTDAIAFAHVSGEILLEGKNPYEVAGQDLAPLIERFGVPETFVTRTLAGVAIDRLVSYPALHTVLYTPFVGLGLLDLRWATLFFEVLSLAIIWVVASPIIRWLLPLAFLVEPNLVIYFTSGGVTDWLWVVPVVIAAVLLHRDRTGWAGIALGLACAVKHHPWFVIPFAAIWVAYREEETRYGDDAGLAPIQKGLWFIGAVALGFVIPNLPFFLWSPGAWLDGVLVPVTQGLIPDGQGLSILSARGVLPLSRDAHGLMALSIFGLLVLAYLLFFNRVRNALWVLPPLVLFASYRSFHSYYIFWLPVAALWLDLEAQRKAGPSGYETPTIDRLATWAIPIAFITGTGLALLLGGVTRDIDQEPLTIQSVSPTVIAGVLEEIRIEITNPRDRDMHVIFDVLWLPYPRRWIPVNGDFLGPNETQVFTLRPPHSDAIPPRRAVGIDLIQTAPFRVRVNPAGQALFTVSHVIHPEPQHAAS